MTNALSFLLLLAVAGAVWLGRAWQASEARARAIVSERESLEVERKELLRRFEQEGQARKRQAEELAELRRRNDKAKRRAEKAPEAPLGTATRIRDLSLDLERAQTALRRVEGERDGLARRAEALQAETATLARRLEEASAPTNDLNARHEAALERQRAELAAGREQLAKQAEELALARQTEARMRKRMDNQEQLYASLRAELDVKKDRLRTQEEQIQRLQALKVAVLD